MEETRNKQIIFPGFITGFPKETDMELRAGTVKLALPQGFKGILVQNLYLSCDPYMRIRVRETHDFYVPPFTPGSVMTGAGISRVVASNVESFSAGDLITGLTGWEEYSFIQYTDQLRKIQVDEKIPLSCHLGLLGMPGLTAFVGFYDICSPKKGERVFVSAAGGAVGQLVGQLAKIHGCYVVGSAGSQEKVDLLKNKLGFDDAFNYKEEKDLVGTLKRYFPEGIDIYFENVGGATLDAVLQNMRNHGRISVCGMISQYNLVSTEGIHNLFMLVTKRIKMEGFLVPDYSHRFPEFFNRVSELYKEGKIVYMEDMHQGLESVPKAFVGLFSGQNVGKQVVCVCGE